MKNWISVEDKLPEFHEKIMFYSEYGGGHRLGFLARNSHKFISGEDKFYKSDVQGWQELPEKPEKRQPKGTHCRDCGIELNESGYCPDMNCIPF